MASPAITLDSQHNRNALSKQLVTELDGALDRGGDGARAIVVRHEGPAFCAGADLKERSDDSGAPDSRPFLNVLERLMDSPAPTIAAVRGRRTCGRDRFDGIVRPVVVVHASVTFALTEVRIGVAPAIISVPILRRVPPGKIAAAMLTGEPFDAHEARSIGLITHVSDDVDGTVDERCATASRPAPRGPSPRRNGCCDHVPTLDRSTGFAEMSALSEELFAAPTPPRACWPSARSVRRSGRVDRTCSDGYSGHQAVADAAHRDDQFRIVGMILDLQPQPSHVGVDQS